MRLFLWWWREQIGGKEENCRSLLGVYFFILNLVDSDHKYEVFDLLLILIKMSSKKQSETSDHPNIVRVD